MSEENVETIRRSFELFAMSGESPWNFIDPDIEVRDHDLPDAVGEVFHGHEGYGRWLAIWNAAWDEYEITLHDLTDAGDQVIATFHLRAKGKGSGVETERENAAVFTVEDGKVTRCDYYGSREGAFEACRS